MTLSETKLRDAYDELTFEIGTISSGQSVPSSTTTTFATQESIEPESLTEVVESAEFTALDPTIVFGNYRSWVEHDETGETLHLETQGDTFHIAFHGNTSTEDDELASYDTFAKLIEALSSEYELIRE